MKKVFLSLFCIFILLLSTSCNTPKSSDFHVGMSYEEVVKVLGDREYKALLGYLYFTDSDGQNVILDLQSPTNTVINKIEKYKAVTPTDKDILQIKEGMTFFEVVQILGLPESPNALSGMLASLYKLSNGESYMIYWDTGYVSNNNVITVSTIANVEK